jgi:hypothetical protein
MPADKTVKVTLAGNEVEWTDIDCTKCDVTFRGGVVSEQALSDEKRYDKFGKWDLKPGWGSPFFKKPRNLYNPGQAVCGARGCTRACMISLEARDVLQNKFHKQFRRSKPWTVDWSDRYDAGPGAPPSQDGFRSETD